MDGDTTERLSQESYGREHTSDGLLERASAFSRSILESIQALAGTTACKGVQIARLKDWAIENDCWIENPIKLGIYVDRGSENEVYMSSTDLKVYKLNDFRYSDDNLQPFFERVFAAQVRKSVDSPPGMLTEYHHHTVHEERQVCYSSHLRPKSLHL